jgi:ribose 5-phosphate isomerase A
LAFVKLLSFERLGFLRGSAPKGDYRVSSPLTQDQLKALVGQAALSHVRAGTWVGVGTGSTVNHFIDALAASGVSILGAVSSSEASTQRLLGHGIVVSELKGGQTLDVYVDGADEIDPRGNMIKGGGAALTREKIVASQAQRFVCIVDESKWVEVLGHFPLPLEVIPMAAEVLIERFKTKGAQARLRMKGETPLVTDNGQHILDVWGLKISEPLAFEDEVSQWPGVVTVGVFAHQRANVCLMGTSHGVKTFEF